MKVRTGVAEGILVVGGIWFVWFLVIGDFPKKDGVEICGLVKWRFVCVNVQLFCIELMDLDADDGICRSAGIPFI